MSKVNKELCFLIIDDSLSAREQYRHMLTAALEFPFRVTEATNAVEALSALDTERMDCILLDENVPGMIGDDLMKLIKNSVNQNTPIILLTGENSAKISGSPQEIDVVACLVKKNLDTDTFIDAVRQAIHHIKPKQNLLLRIGAGFLYGAGSLTLAIALPVLTGWYLHSNLLVEMFADGPYMQGNTALLFVFMAFGLLSLNKFPSCALVMSILVFLIATVTLLQYVSGINSGLDSLLFKPFLPTIAANPGRMAPNTALSFMAGSIALFFNVKENLFRYWQVFAIYLCGLVFILGLVALVGYLLHIPTAYGWGKLTGMNILTAFCMTATGMALLLFSLGRLPKERLHIKQFPLATAVFGSIFFLLFWQALIANDHRQLLNKTQMDAKVLTLRIREKMTLFKLELERMQKRLAYHNPVSKLQWQLDAAIYLHDKLSYEAISLISTGRNTMWFINRRGFVPSDIDRRMIDDCLVTKRREAHLKDGFYLSSPERSNLEYFCFLSHGAAGWLVGLVNMPEFIDDILKESDMGSYRISLQQNNRTRELQHGNGRLLSSEWLLKEPVAGTDNPLQLLVWPTQALLERESSSFPTMTLISGLMLTFLLATVQFFWVKSNRQKNNLQAAIKKQQITEKRFQAITISANDAIIMLDNDARVVFWNRAATEIFGYDSREVTGHYIHWLIIPGRYLEALESGFRTFQTTGKGTIVGKSIEAMAKKKNGMEFPVEISISSVFINEQWESVAIVRDITERKKADEIVRHNANYDILTDLPNRALFSDLLKTALSKAERSGTTVCLLAIDLDNFKPVNDTYGHEMGDDLLKLVSLRLQQCVRKSDTVARVGGDEFSVILTNVHNDQETVLVVQKILLQLAGNFVVKGANISIGASIGIASYPQDSTQQEPLIIKADYAMYAAKKSGKSQYCFYSKCT